MSGVSDDDRAVADATRTMDDGAPGARAADVLDESATSAQASRAQHLIPGTLLFLLALVVAWLSFTAEPAAAYLFPRLISVVLLLLAGWNFARCVLGLSRVGSGIALLELTTIAPGVVISALLMFVAARLLGFYVAAFIAFFLIYAWYDPASHRDPGVWARRLAVTAGFMAVIYGLFSMLLQVQTPRGIFV